MEGPPIRVDRLSPKQAAQAGDLLAASHADYPSFRHLFPDAATRRRVLRRFMTAVARDAAASGRALIAHDKSGFLGVALWMPPGSYPLSLRRRLQMTPALLGVALVAGGAFLAFARVGSTLEQAHPADRGWYLQALGVHPRVQRRGIGRLLLAPVLALADEAGLVCQLHTADPANIGYYRRFGFEIIEPAVQVFPKGPSYIGMTRPAPERLGGVPVASTHRANQRVRISAPGAKL